MKEKEEPLNLVGNEIELAYKIRKKFIEVLSTNQSAIDKEMLEFMVEEIRDTQWYIDRKDILNTKKDAILGILKLSVFKDIKEVIEWKEHGLYKSK